MDKESRCKVTPSSCAVPKRMRWHKMASELSEISYGVISAYTTPMNKKNDQNHTKLFKKLRALGYDPVETQGEWNEMPEKAWFVPGISLQEIVNLARDFRQDAVLFCTEGSKPRLLPVSGVSERPMSLLAGQKSIPLDRVRIHRS
jgi:hypothetical protein